jgi:hypothetical protein
MSEIALRRRLSKAAAGQRGAIGEQWKTDRGWQDKSPDVRLWHVVGLIEGFAHWARGVCWRPDRKVQRIQRVERHRPSFCGRPSL